MAQKTSLGIAFLKGGLVGDELEGEEIKCRENSCDIMAAQKRTHVHWVGDSIQSSHPLSLSELWEMVKDREAWHAAVHGIAKSWTWLSDWTATINERDPTSSEGDQPWDFFGKNDAIAETPVLWPPHVKSWLIGEDSDDGRDWGQEEKGTTEDEMAGWHHRLDGREFEWTLGDGDRQGGLVCCDSWGRKEPDTTERLNWTDWMKIGTIDRMERNLLGARYRGKAKLFVQRNWISRDSVSYNLRATRSVTYQSPLLFIIIPEFSCFCWYICIKTCLFF